MKRRTPVSRSTASETAHAIVPATRLEVEVTRAIDQELAWFFGYAESANRLGNLALVPPYVAAQLAASSEAEETMTKRALALFATVQLAIRGVPTHCAGVLRAVYTPRRWPIAVVREFGSLSAVVVRLVCTENPWPERSSHDGLEHANAMHLARMLAQGTASPGALRKTARRLAGSAITAYVRARAKGAATLASS